MRPLPKLVSILLATRNAMPHLRAQVESLLSQISVVPTELIVGDNGSSDETLIYLRTLGDALRVVDASAAIGKRGVQKMLVKESSGELLVFVDADDVCASGWLSALIEGSLRYAVVGGSLELELLNGADALRARRWLPNTDRLPSEKNGGPYPVGANAAFWREVWEQIDPGAVPESPAEDREFSYLLQERGISVGFIRDAVVHYRLRTNPASVRSQMRAYGRADAWLAATYGRLGASGDSVRVASREYVRLCVLAAQARLEGDDFHWSIGELSRRAGRIEGSLRYRTLCL